MTMTAIRIHPIDLPGYSETWPREPASAARARGLVQAAFNAWGLGQLIDDGQLIASELVGNAVRHAGCRLLRVSVTLMGPSRVRLAVADRSSGRPRMQAPLADSVEGRGLLLVNELADCWDVEFRSWGKVIWADLLAGEPDRSPCDS